MFRSKALRPITGVVLVTFTALTLQPLTAAAQLPSAPKRQQTSSDTDEERFSRTLNEIHEILKEVVPQAAMPHKVTPAAATAAGKPGEKVLQAVGPKMRLESERAKPLPGVNVAAKVKTLRGKYKELKSLEAEVSKGFKETEKHIRDKNLPPEILARHEAAVAEYEKRKAEFGTLMAAVEAAADGKGELQSALASLGDFMAKYPNAKTHTPTDPNNLPWGSPKPVTRAPYTSPAQFKTSRLFGETVKVAQAGSLSGISLPSTVLPTTPMPADTAPTEDVQITQAIRDLATSLGNNPVKIYNWVRNNIQFVPSYGSIQGSDMTLQTKRGNAFDTASLLIALLRTAGVPARYVYGTIEVPADSAMNWVGGVTVPQAAQSLMGQGGIPNIGVGLGGQIRSIRLEHVWVEAFVDYVPSRGAVNRNPNTWVPLDASFKQYRFNAGFELGKNVPFDASTVISQLQSSATTNVQEGWVTGVSPGPVQSAFTDFRSRIRTYILARDPTATLEDIVGSQQIIEQSPSIFAGTLPYRRIATGARFQAVPDNLRWKFRYNIYSSELEKALDEAALAYTASIAKLAGRKITLSFAPASDADRQVINSFLPTPHPDGSPFEPTELPGSLPGYLIRLTAVLKVDDQLVVSSAPFVMGSELIQSSATFDPVNGWQSGGDNHPIVGEYFAVGLLPLSVSRSQLLAASKDVGDIEALLLQQGDALVDLGSILSRFLYATVTSYYATLDGLEAISGRADGVSSYRLPSFGTFGKALSTLYSFGVPRVVKPAGFAMDIDRLSIVVEAKDGDRNRRLSHTQTIGALASLLEGWIPERIFSTPSSPAVGISAMSLLSTANQLGTRIYTITDPFDPVLNGLAISEDVKSELRNAVASGKKVLFPGSTLSVASWHGVGYLIIDPDTGAGAYLVSGGINGGILEFIGGPASLINYIFTEYVISGHLMGVPKTMLESLGAWGIYLGFLFDILELSSKCSGDMLTGAVIVYTAAVLASIALMVALTAFFPLLFWTGIIIGLIVGELLTAFRDMLIRDCVRLGLRRREDAVLLV